MTIKLKILALLEKTYADFCNCEGGEGWLKIDGKEYATDAGYALEGMSIFMEVFKRRLAELSSVTPQPNTKNDKIDCKHTDCNNCVNHKYCDYEPTTKNNLEVDCISRAEVLKLMQDNWHTHNGDWAMQESMDDIRALPSVTPQEPRKGHWMGRWYAGHNLHFHVCSECNEEFSCDMETGISIDNYRYCPNCGADMREVEE